MPAGPVKVACRVALPPARRATELEGAPRFGGNGPGRLCKRVRGIGWPAGGYPRRVAGPPAVGLPGAGKPVRRELRVAVVKFDAYDLDPTIYDEMFLPDGAPREHCWQLYETLNELSAVELTSIHERVNRSFSNEGITFTVYGDDEAEERIIPIDCLPGLMAAASWRQVETGLTQRIKALNLFLQDVYGDARIVHDGVIPEDVVFGCPQYRTEMQGYSPPHGSWAAICGTGLVRTNDGFMVLEDNLRVPSGVSYMLANRKASKASLRRLYRSMRVREAEHYGQELLATLQELSPGGLPTLP